MPVERSKFGKRVACLLAILLLGGVAVSQDTSTVLPRIRIMEFRAGSVASEMSCTVVYLDGHFYSEEETHSIGERRQASVSTGDLSPAEIQTMNQVLDGKDFRALTSPLQAKRLVQENQHLLQISVPRENGMQDLIYENDRARRPSQTALQPVLDWWKKMKAQHPPRSRTEKITQCLGNPR